MANELIHNAKTPTYIFGSSADGKSAEGHDKGSFQDGVADHVLFATDFSKNSEVAFNYLIEMIPLKEVASIIHVQDEYRISPYLDSKIEEFNIIDSGRLEAMRKVLLDKGVRRLRLC